MVSRQISDDEPTRLSGVLAETVFGIPVFALRPAVGCVCQERYDKPTGRGHCALYEGL